MMIKRMRVSATVALRRGLLGGWTGVEKVVAQGRDLGRLTEPVGAILRSAIEVADIKVFRPSRPNPVGRELYEFSKGEDDRIVAPDNSRLWIELNIGRTRAIEIVITRAFAW